MADAFVACAFFMPEVRGLRRGQAPLSEVGSDPLPEMGSGPLARDGVRHFARGGVRHFARDGVRPLCLTPEGIVTYLHLRFILRCFIIVGAGDSTNIA